MILLKEWLLVMAGMVALSRGSVSPKIMNREIKSKEDIVQRFILTDHTSQVLLEWTSWQQHVACLTTCVQGFEAKTVDCCTTGDNRLCFDLPWTLLNNSVGNCPGFCERKHEISCKETSSVVCGSDGRIYRNRSTSISKRNDTTNALTSSTVLSSSSTTITSPSSSSSLTTSATTAVAAPAMTSHMSPATFPANTSQEWISPSTSTAKLASTLVKNTSSKSMSTILVSSQSTIVFERPTTTKLIVSTSTPTPPPYCQNKHSISCGFTFNIVCGSDHKFYANLCMLALGRCDNPTLTQKDRQYCSSG